MANTAPKLNSKPGDITYRARQLSRGTISPNGAFLWHVSSKSTPQVLFRYYAVKMTCVKHETWDTEPVMTKDITETILREVGFE